jgi:hypothetical protein
MVSLSVRVSIVDAYYCWCCKTMRFVDNPLYFIRFGEITGLKAPYHQWIAVAGTAAFVVKGIPSTKRMYWAVKYEWATSEQAKLRFQSKLGMSDITASELQESLNRVKVRGAKWLCFGGGIFLFTLCKRTVAVKRKYTERAADPTDN